MAPFFLQRRKGAGSGRVFAFASIANQPHTLENVYVPGSGVGASTIANRRALSRRAAYIRKPLTPLTVGSPVTKDMSNENYTFEFNPNDYPQFFPDMEPFIEENIELGDKNVEDQFRASYWQDLGDDVFDDWGYFYLYDVNSGKYYFPLINPQNQPDGLLFTQTFNAFERTFTIKHGWAAQGIFKFDISVADELPFRFGAYGNIGSDGNYTTADLTQNYTMNGQNLTMYYHRDKENNDDIEQLYTYWIPKNISENLSQTYYNFYGIHEVEGEFGFELVEDYVSMLSKNVTTGLIVYFAKSNDVKDWVINDLGI